MNILINIGIAVAMFALMFYIAAHYEIRKDERTGGHSTRRLFRMRRVSGQIVGIAGVLILISAAVPADETEKEEVKTELQSESEEAVKDTGETDTPKNVTEEASSPPEVEESPTYAFENTQAEADFFTAIELTLDSGITTMQDVSAMSRMCGRLCPDVPGNEWGLQLEPMNQEVFKLDHYLYDLARALDDIPEGSSPNIDFAALNELVQDMRTMNELISIIMTKTDWETWDDGWDTIDEANRLMEKMYLTNVYTVPSSN